MDMWASPLWSTPVVWDGVKGVRAQSAAQAAKLLLAVGANPRKTVVHEPVKPRKRRRCKQPRNVAACAADVRGVQNRIRGLAPHG